MTDPEKVAAETHPILEAMARAMAHELNAAESPESDQLHVSWLNAALAAARVILSAEPSDAQCDAFVDAAGCPAAFVVKHALKHANAALLREIEGSEPATRDVETRNAD